MSEKDSQNQKDSSKPEEKQVVEMSKWRKAMGKRWVFPAIYVAAAAIILTLIWAYQDNGETAKSTNQPTTTNQKGQDTAEGQNGTQTDALPATAQPESMQWPISGTQAIQVIKPFYDSSGSDQEKQAAMVEYNHTFTPHSGVDLATPDHKTFDVVAAMSGKVTEVQNHPIVGSQVEIQNDDNMVMIYQSLSDVQVKIGDKVKQGQVIAEAGRNELEKDEGVHLHFEVRQAKDGQVIDPNQLLPVLQSAKGSSTTMNSQSSDENSKPENKKESDQEKTTQTN